MRHVGMIYCVYSLRRVNLSFSLVLILVISAIFPIMLQARDFVVVNANDAGPGSFRAAIDSANTVPGYDTVSFNIPGGTPDHIISVLLQLPALEDTCGTLIDGYTQPGSWLWDPPEDMWHMIVLDGHLAGDLHGIVIRSSNNTIQGLTIVNFKQDGVRIEANPAGANDNHIYANLIGIYDYVHAMGNGVNHNDLWAGVHIVGVVNDSGYAKKNIIEGNVVSANYADGIRLVGSASCEVCSTSVFKNNIGTCQFGASDKGNIHSGVCIGGGTYSTMIDSCRIAGNGFDGLSIFGESDSLYTQGNNVQRSIIGFTNAPNDKNGIGIGVYGDSLYRGFAPDNAISHCTITNSGLSGVAVWEHPSNSWNADGNMIIANGIDNNGLLGIDLGADGVTYNDTGDVDNGPNQEINFPVIEAADAYESISHWWTFIITGYVDIDTLPEQSTVEIFGLSSRDPTGYGEGPFLLFTAVPHSDGSWSVVEYWVPYTPDWVSATVTDVNGNTSEFSYCDFVDYHYGVSESSIGSVFQSNRLEQNQPNPFNEFTEIRYSMDNVNQNLELVIHDVTGRLVRKFVLVPDIQCGTIFWNGRDEEGRSVSPGVYVYRIKTGECTISRKMIKVR